MSTEIQGREPRRRGSTVAPLSRGNRPSRTDDSYPPTRSPDASTGPPALFAGRYEIVKELGRGGMGVVSRARDTRLSRDVAIKAPLHLRDEESLRRFFKEAEAAAKLDHPNICRILDLGEADGLPFIVLAFIDGKTLAQVVGRRRVEPIRAAKIARSVARTIQFAHDRGVIHRDLKPANLMVGAHRDLIVMDFGLARLEGEERKTQTGQVFGTPAYMSPEQVQGQAQDMGKGCDIYALGVIFYELLTGRLPFRGASWELPEQIIRVPPIPPSTIQPEVDPELDAIVLRAMAKKIEDRFASMTEFAEAIATYLRRVGSLSNSALPQVTKAVVPQSPKLPEAGFSIRLKQERLREPVRSRARTRDASIWVVMAIIGLVGATLYHAIEPKIAPPTSEPSRSRVKSKGIAKPVVRSVSDLKTRDGETPRPIPRPGR